MVGAVRLDVCSATDAGSHVLFDPTLLLDVHAEGFDPAAELERAVEAGRALEVSAGGDGAIQWAVLVGEPLPPDLEAHATLRATDLLLRAPAGRLVAGGVEDLAVIDEERGGTPLELPAGDWLADVFEATFDEGALEAALRADPATAADFRREQWAGPAGALLIFGGVIALVFGAALGVKAAGGVSVWGAPDPAASQAVLRAAAVCGGGLLAIAVGAVWLRLLLPGEEYHRRRRAHAARFPDVVLVLRPAPAGHDARGGRVDLTA